MCESKVGQARMVRSSKADLLWLQLPCGTAVRAPPRRQCQRYRLRARWAVAAGRSSTAPIGPTQRSPQRQHATETTDQSRCPPGVACPQGMLYSSSRGAFSSTPQCSPEQLCDVGTQARHCNPSPRALRHTVVEQCNPYRPKESTLPCSPRGSHPSLRAWHATYTVTCSAHSG